MYGGGAIGAFRQQCSWRFFGDEVVYNVNGSSTDHRAPSWICFWEWWFFATGNGGCTRDCKIRENETPHTDRIVGGHMEKATHDGWWYILPICQGHNAPGGWHDRGGGGGPLATHEIAWAVRIHLH